MFLNENSARTKLNTFCSEISLTTFKVDHVTDSNQTPFYEILFSIGFDFDFIDRE